jgi:uncharacterized protein YbjQ (UPF0145 family)
MKLFFYLAILIIAYLVGSRREKRHFAEIAEKEAALAYFSVTVDEFIAKGATDAFLVSDSMVVGKDAFKSFMGSLSKIFGGGVNAYQSLLDRARRESVLRIKQKAIAGGASEVVNLRFEFASGETQGIEILAYGTAIRRS